MGTKTWFSLGAPAFALSFLTACAVGPDFESPKLPAVANYAAQPEIPPTVASGGAAGAAQHFSAGADIPAEWWTLFRSPALDSLIRHALTASPDLQAAKAALRKAHEQALAQAGTLFPAISAQLNDTRASESGVSLGLGPSFNEIYSLTNAQVSVSYAPDVFGGARRAIEAADAQDRYQAFQLDAAYLSLTANLVTAAVQEGALRGQIEATKDILLDEQRQVNFVQQQFAFGGAARSDVLALQAELARAQATLPPLEKQLAQLRNQIAALSGNFPSETLEQSFSLDGLALPVDLPVSLPSDLVRQRPDVRAAEEQMHYASAEVGVATANQFPQFSLTGNFGAQSAGIPNLVSSSVPAWNLGGSVTQPIFQGGQLWHQRRAAEAALDQAEAQYRSTVLTAFRNVADTLRALSSDADALNAQMMAERTAADSLALSQQQYGFGSLSYLSLLTAERTYQEAKIALIQAQAARFADTAALFQALGGGWWHQADLQSASAD
jgi:NodT family efflux transporter outer membrane factor (OMF) lipoprotein